MVYHPSAFNSLVRGRAGDTEIRSQESRVIFASWLTEAGCMYICVKIPFKLLLIAPDLQVEKSRVVGTVVMIDANAALGDSACVKMIILTTHGRS